MMRFCTDAPKREVACLAPEAHGIEVVHGMTTFTVAERDAACVVSEIHRAGWRVDAGAPRHPHASTVIRRW